MKTLMMAVALMTFGHIQNASATNCKGKCNFTVQSVLKELSETAPDGSKEYDFRNYCSQVNGTVWNATTCSGIWGYRCIGEPQAHPSNGLDLSAYGADSYEASQKLRESCARRKPTASCSKFVSEGYIEGEISCN